MQLQLQLPLLLASVALCCLAPAAAAPPAPSTLQKKPQKPAREVDRSRTAPAAIRGRIVSADSGAALRRARVVISAAGLPRPRLAESDDEGRFEFTDVRPGRLTLAASKTGYAPLQFGQRHSFEGGQPIDVAAGQIVEDIVLALPTGGVLTGRITDETGEPIAAAPVAAMRWRYQDGLRQLTRVGRSVETNDLGEFRLFDLPPSTYVVGTTSGLAGETLAYGMAYYPGTANPAEAQGVPVKPGEERSGLEFVLPVTRLARLSGTVVAAGGEPLIDFHVQAVAGMGATFVSYRGSVKGDGTFTVSNVPPGMYDLTASARHALTGDRRQGAMPVEVSGGDLAGLFVRVLPGRRMTGRIAFDANGPPPFTPGSVSIYAEPLDPRLGGPVGTIKGDWTFELADLTGGRLVRITKLPQGWALKSVTLAGRDVTDSPLDLSGTGDIAGLTVVLTDRITSLEGRTRNAEGEATGDASVVVFAKDVARWGGRSRFVQSARPDRDGKYRVEGLPPGAYLAIALDYLEDGIAGDPAFLESLRSRASAITLHAGETRDLDLTVTGKGGLR